MEKRVVGIDVTRAIAIFGMIIVNFKLAFGNSGNEYLVYFASIFEGKASAIFVTLAGIGISLGFKGAIGNSGNEIKKNSSVIKKAIFLLVIGLVYSPIWPADILHYYGIFMLITMLFLKTSDNTILLSAFLIVLSYPFLMIFFNYDAGWNFITFEYTDFWTFEGFFRNLFFNGFHPVFPWVAFMLVGLWFGRQDLSNKSFLKNSLKMSGVIYLSVALFSKFLVFFLSEGDKSVMEELELLFGTGPIPPLPIYMISSGALAIFIISLCVLVSQKYKDSLVIKSLENTGKLALTFYVAHVIVGMGIVEIIDYDKMGNLSIDFSVCYALFFSANCILFAYLWLKKYKDGPLESIMRRIT